MSPDDNAPPPRVEEEEKPEGEGDKRRLFERAIPELFKRAVERAVETGVGKLAEGPESLRHFMGDMKLPKEVLHYLYTQIDDTKSGLYRVVAKEIRDVLEHTQFADEITKVLTKLSFEIRTEIRFVPNEAAARSAPSRPAGAGADEPEEEESGQASSGLPKPEISTQVTVKDRSKEARRGRPRREDT